MKNIFRFLMAVAVLFTASCAKEDISSSIGGGEAEVSFTVDLQDLGSRAYGDGTQVNTLRYYVYDGDTYLDQLSGQKPIAVGAATTVNLVLLKGMTYNIVFWADRDGYYTYDTAAKTITVDYSTVTANEEWRDAFCKFVPAIDPATASNDDKNIVLTRPFAQLNAVATDMNTLALSGVNISKSKVTIDAYSTLNLATGEVTGLATKTLVAGNILENGLLSMNYFLAPAEGYTPNVTFTFENNKNIDFGASFTYVPLKRNYRTNIIGSLLSKSTDFKVTIEKNFFEPAEEISVWDGQSKTQPAVTTNPETGKDEYVVDSASDLAWLADLVNGTLSSSTFAATRAAATFDIVLNTDIDLNNMQWTKIGTEAKPFSGSFDGNGHVIKNLNIVEAEAIEGKAHIGFFGYAKDATIKDINFENVNLNIACLDIDHSQGHIAAVAGSLYGTSTIENVTVKGNIKIESTVTANGASRVAVIAGGNESTNNITMKNVHVVASEGSYLKANNNVGALAGQLQGKNVFENCSSNINVTGTKFFAGGIIGLAAGDSQFTNCHTTGNVTVTAGREGRAHDQYRVGGIAGGWADGAKNVCTLVDCSYTGTISGKNSDGSVTEVFDYAGYVGRGYTLNNCAGSKVVIDGKEYVQAYNTAAEAGLYIVDGVYEVGTLAALKIVANKVNSGADYYTNKNIKLIADIDLKNEEWIPIGSATKDHGFCGNFDGNGKKIKNLKMTTLVPDTDGYVYAGLFGVTEGTETTENTIENLVIENVNINTTGHIVSAAIAYPYYTTVENITVQGDINITGGDYTAGVLAYTRRCVNASNIAINGKTGSTITGHHTVGGVISDIHMNGGLTADYSNFSASNLTITATDMHVGGISGIICLQTLDGATVKNVTIVCDDARKGIVSGALGDTSTIKNIVHENVTGATNIVGATYKEAKEVYVTGNVYTSKPIVGTIVECAGQKAIVFSVENGIKAVSVAELNLNGKNWQNAVDWAKGLGTGWALASINELDEIHAVRATLNNALEADSAENALFCETDYIASGKYAIYLSSTDAVGTDPQGEEYFANRVHLKYFNLTGYLDYPYSTFATISKYAPLRDNNFARGVVTLE